jgi:hypothetical protein
MDGEVDPCRIPEVPHALLPFITLSLSFSAALPSRGFSQNTSQLTTQCYIFINHPKATLNIFHRSKMGTANEAEHALEMEAMRKEYSSWHPCRVSI